jgi:hypothetical protein
MTYELTSIIAGFTVLVAFVIAMKTEEKKVYKKKVVNTTRKVV